MSARLCWGCCYEYPLCCRCQILCVGADRCVRPCVSIPTGRTLVLLGLRGVVVPRQNDFAIMSRGGRPLCLPALFSNKIDESRQAQKKRRIVSIVVSWNQSVFQRLMLVEYQMELDLASGVAFHCGYERVVRWDVERISAHIYVFWFGFMRKFIINASHICVALLLGSKLCLRGRTQRSAPTQRV